MPAAQHIGCVGTASTSKSAPYMARRRIKVNLLINSRDLPCKATIIKIIGDEVNDCFLMKYLHRVRSSMSGVY